MDLLIGILIAVGTIALFGGGAWLLMAKQDDSLITQYPLSSGGDLYKLPFSPEKKQHNARMRIKRRIGDLHRRIGDLERRIQECEELARYHEGRGEFEQCALLMAEAADALRRKRLLKQDRAALEYAYKERRTRELTGEDI